MDDGEHGISEGCYGAWACAGSDGAAVLAQDDIASPVQAVIDEPVIAPQVEQGVGAGLLGRQAGDGMGDLVADRARFFAGPFDAADLGGPGPTEMRHACAAMASCRVSMRPRPFSTVCTERTRSGGGLRSWAGGAAPRRALISSEGQGVAKGDGEIGHQGRLIGFDGEQVVALSVPDALADGSLAERCIARDHGALERQPWGAAPRLDSCPSARAGVSKGQGRPGRRGIARPARNGGTTWRKAGDTGPDERQQSLDPHVGRRP